MLKKISFLTVATSSFFMQAFHSLSAASSTSQIAVETNEHKALNLLPETYQNLVKQKLNQAAENKNNFVSAILEIEPSQREGLAFLIANMPQKDLKSLSKEFMIENVNLAYKVKNEAPWAQNLPDQIFFNEVLPYANVNELRDNWRLDFYQKFYPIAKSEGNVEKIVKKFNQYVFDTLNVHYHAYLRKKPHQSPYESIRIGYASCTGLSILLVDALRAVGVPARLAGIVSWPQTGGNHTWVEVWDNGNWHYIGASEPGNYDHTWFTNQVKFANPNDRNQSVYAVSFQKTDTSFPMIWNFDDTSVSAINVTLRYLQ